MLVSRPGDEQKEKPRIQDREVGASEECEERLKTAQDAGAVLYDVLLHCKMLCGNFVIFPIASVDCKDVPSEEDKLQQVMNDRSALIRRGKAAKGDINQIHKKADVVMASAVAQCGDSEYVVDAGFTLNVRRDDLRHQVYAFNDHIQSLQHHHPSALPS